MATEKDEKKEKYQGLADAVEGIIRPHLAEGEKLDTHLIADDPLYMVLPTVYTGEGESRKRVYSMLIPCEGFSDPKEPAETRLPSDPARRKRHKALSGLVRDEIRAAYELIVG